MVLVSRHLVWPPRLWEGNFSMVKTSGFEAPESLQAEVEACSADGSKSSVCGWSTMSGDCTSFLPQTAIPLVTS